jgi:DNA-binding winged helix-turn-helix (wHTH) protein/tetratricopeptide (TPR) repeat protein
MLEFLAFRLDTVNQCLWRRTESGEDERIRLSPRPFALLRYLVEHPGRLITEEEILGAVWPKLYVQPESVKTQLHEIRKVLRDHPKTPQYIETVPRRGYQFIAPVRERPAPALAAAASQPTRRHVVGREQALSELREQLRAAVCGQRQGVFVCGEPGIGKTALVDEFQCQASSDVPVLRIARGQCIEAYGGTEAYYPILEALGQLCAGSGAAPIVEILAAQAPTWLVQFPALLTERHREVLRQEILGATRERMLREILTAFDAIAAETPLLLVLEDLQWVDHSTVDLIAALARRRTTAKLMLIATSRTLDLLPSDHALRALKQDLLVHQLSQRIDLEPLAEAQVAEYLRAESPQGNLPKGLAELVYRHSGGNPLFMVAVVDHLTQRGFIAKENGNWQVRVPLEEIELGVPETLRQMIEAQIERLSEKEQLALEAASVQGVAFSGSVCAAVINGDVAEYENLYDSMAHRRRIVHEVGVQEFPVGTVSRRYEFLHALYREVLYQRQSSLRRRKLHRYIGERLEALYSPQPSEVGSELAHHFEESGDWPRTIKYQQLAADTAQQRHADSEVSTLMHRALSLVSRLPEMDRASAETAILEKLASTYVLSMDARALEIYERLAERAAFYGLLDVEVHALMEMAFFWAWTNSQRCLEVLDRAMERSTRQADPSARAKSRMRCSFLRIWADAWKDDDAVVCREALREIRQAGDPVALAPHLIDNSFLLFMCSEYRESRRSALEGLAILTEGRKENPCASVPQINGSTAAYLAELFLGEWGEALQKLDSTLVTLTKNGNDGWAQALRIWRACLNVQAMDFSGALGICESAVRALGNAITPSDRRFYLALAGTAEVALGHHKAGLEHLSVARREMDQQRVLNDWHTRLLLEAALTELRIAGGDIAQARVQADQLLRITLATRERTFQALAWEANARVAMTMGDFAHAAKCIAEAVTTMEGFEVPLAAWRVHATAAVLDDRRGNVESALRHRELSRATILRIANSLAPEHPLRITFLSAAPIATILRGGLSG